MSKLYECHNPACTLGARGEAGHFTSGMTAEQVNLLTGKPVDTLVDGEDYGEGICPNCGEQGVEDEEGEHVSLQAKDANESTDSADEGGDE